MGMVHTMRITTRTVVALLLLTVAASAVLSADPLPTADTAQKVPRSVLTSSLRSTTPAENLAPAVVQPTVVGDDGKHNPPVVMIPGIASSRLYARWNYDDQDMDSIRRVEGHTFAKFVCTKKSSDWEKQWFEWQVAVPNSHLSACWRYRMVPLFNLDPNDPSKSSWSNRRNVEFTAWRTPPISEDGKLQCSNDFCGLRGVSSLADIPGVKALGVFRSTITRLEKMFGYREQVDMFGAPYDFRLIADLEYSNYYYRALKLMIEHAVEVSGGQGMRIVTHSLGGLVAKRFLSDYLPRTMGAAEAQEWKDKYVAHWIPVAAPFAGAPKAFRSAVAGDDAGLGLLCEVYECDDWYKRVMSSFAGLAWLVPDGRMYAGMPLIQFGRDLERSVSPDDSEGMHNIFTMTGAAAAGNGIKHVVEPFLREILYEPPLVPVTALAGRSANTEMHYDFHELPTVDTGVTKPSAVHWETEWYLSHTGVKSPVMLEVLRAGIPPDGNTDNLFYAGDGTVPYVSSHLPVIWAENGSRPNVSPAGRKYPVVMTDVVGSEFGHAEMLNVDALTLAVARLVVGPPPGGAADDKAAVV